MRVKGLVSALTVSCAFLAPQVSMALDKDEMEKNLFPYKQGFPSYPGIKPGLVIDASNIDQYKDLFLPGFVKVIKEGYYSIKVGEQSDLPPHPGYVEATYKYAPNVKLGQKVGEIEGYVAGRPFPFEPDPNDPMAGVKLAFNYKYGQNWGDNAAVIPFIWRYVDMKTGNVEKVLTSEFHFLNWKHRISVDPKPNIEPNPSDIYRSIYVKVLEPAELRNTQLLINRYDDDLKFDDTYLYLGFQKRVRKLAQGNVTDSFLGSDLMIEDFEGYNSRVSDMKWTFKGKRLALLPMYKRNEVEETNEGIFKTDDGYKFVKFGGKGTCFPLVTWQLREAYELEAVPVDPNHPVGKRVFLMDKQTGVLNGQITTYDRKGEIWKVWFVGKAHPDFHLPINKGSNIALDDAGTIVDVQSQHCTTLHFKGIIDLSLNPTRLFTVQNLRAGD